MATARPDGYTLLALPGPILHPRPTPQVGAELAPAILLARGPMVIAGPAGMGLPNLAAVVASAKAEPDKWNFGTAGVGSSHHFAGELLNERAVTKIVHVPYRGGGAVIADALGGRLPLVSLGAGPLTPHIKSGAVRAYAVTMATRLPELAEVPTLAEAGYPGVDLSQWFGLAAPVGAPQDIVARLNREISAIMSEPAIVAAMTAQGVLPAPGTPEAFGAFFARENAL